MYHLYILIVFLNNLTQLPALEWIALPLTPEKSVCDAAGEMRTSQLNQDRNQVASWVCIKW